MANLIGTEVMIGGRRYTVTGQGGDVYSLAGPRGSRVTLIRPVVKNPRGLLVALQMSGSSTREIGILTDARGGLREAGGENTEQEEQRP